MSPKARAGESPAQGPTHSLFSQLRMNKALLDAADDGIGQAIMFAEEAFREFVGIRISVIISRYDDGDHTELAYGKYGGDWLLGVERWSIGPDGEDHLLQHTALRHCSRQQRAEMFAEGHLQRLLVAAVETMETVVKQRQLAMEQVKQFDDAVSAVLGEAKPSSNSDDSDIPF
jgi:hypothetical protein